jgi:hypothetical protein
MSWTKTNKVRVKYNIPIAEDTWWEKGTETDVEYFTKGVDFSEVLEDLYEHSSCEGGYKALGDTVYRVLYKDTWIVKSVRFTEDHLDPTKEVFPTIELASARCREIIDSKRVLNTSSAINTYLNTIDILSSKEVSKTPFGELVRDMDAIKACVKDLKRLLQ